MSLTRYFAADTPPPTRGRTVAYWALTALLLLPLLAGAVQDVLHAEPAVEIVTGELRFPAYVLTIIGIAKFIAVAIIAAPGLRRLKEWAYAGVAVDFVGASMSHWLATPDNPPIGMVVLPIALLVVALGSYFLRPPSRRLPS